MARISAKDFVGTRCRFQRLRDAKIFNGWITGYFGQMVEVTTSTDSAVQIGDEFRFEGYGNQISAVFHATLDEVGTLDVDSAAKVMAIEGSTTQIIEARQVVFRMVVSGVVRFSTSKEPMRMRVPNLYAELEREGVLWKGFCVDVSEKGAGMIFRTPVEPETDAILRLHTIFGIVECDAQTRYCRLDTEYEGQYRVGLRLGVMGRLDRPRWERFLKEGA